MKPAEKPRPARVSETEFHRRLIEAGRRGGRVKVLTASGFKNRADKLLRNFSVETQ